MKRNCITICGVAAALVMSAATARFVIADGNKATVPFTLGRTTTVLTGPLNKDGTVDYVAAWNKQYGAGVTPDQNGFADYVRIAGPTLVLGDAVRESALALVHLKETTENRRMGWKYIPWELHMDKLARTEWGADQAPKAAAILSERAASLDALVVAANKKYWWYPAVTRNGGGDARYVSIPAFAPLVEMAQCLCARATLRAHAGDFAGFLRTARSDQAAQDLVHAAATRASP